LGNVSIQASSSILLSRRFGGGTILSLDLRFFHTIPERHISTCPEYCRYTEVGVIAVFGFEEQVAMKCLVNGLRSVKRDDKGSISIEFGILASVLIVMLLSGVEFGRFLIAGQKADRSVAVVSDMVAQQTSLQSPDMKDIFQAAGQILSQYHYRGKGILIVSHVHAATAGQPKVTWQEFSSDTHRSASKIGKPGGPAKLPKSITVKAGDTIMVVETKVRFDPMLFDLAIGSRDIYRVSYHRPRKSEKVAYTKTGSTAIDSKNCESGRNPGVCGSSGAASSIAAETGGAASSASASSGEETSQTASPSASGSSASSSSSGSSLLGAMVGALTGLFSGGGRAAILAGAKAGAAVSTTADTASSFRSTAKAASEAAKKALAANPGTAGCVSGQASSPAGCR